MAPVRTAVVPTLEDIKVQLRPGDRLLVVADSCTDDTAAVARLSGVEIVERHDSISRTPSARIIMTRAFNAWFGSLLAIAIFTPISVLWLDKPIALFVHDTLGRQILGGGVASAPILSIPLLSGFVFVVCGLSAMLGREFSKLETVVLLCDVSTLAAETIKNELKFVFGRTWPESWEPNIQSFIRDDVYGFHFFQFGKSFESFPSGHAAVVAAVMSVLWILFPKLRRLCSVCVVAADVALVALNLHFLSDVIAGTFVGVSTGLFTIAAWRVSCHLSASAPTRQIE
jgi:membrane-associated phospholipid phosphatase